MDLSKWLTLAVAAERLGLGYHYTRELVLQGRVKGVQIPAGLRGRILVDPADLDRLIRERRKAAR